MRATDLFENYRERINPPYSKKDIPAILGTLFILFAIPLTAALVLQSREPSGKAVSPGKAKEANKIGQVRKYASDEILIKVKKGTKIKAKPTPTDTGLPTLNALNKKYKVKKIKKVAKESTNSKKGAAVFRWYKVTFPVEKKVIKESRGDNKKIEEDPKYGVVGEALIQKAVEEYKSKSEVVEAQPNQVFEALAVPNDYYYNSTSLFSYGDLWGLNKIQAANAWDTTTGSDSVIVAVVDTGVDYNHPDLKDHILKNNNQIVGYDYYNNDSNPMDDNGHGTHVAGTVGAVGNNDTNHSTDSGTRLVGVNWKVKIIPIKFLSSDGRGYTDDAVSSWQFAVDNGAKVINNSWGGYVSDPALTDSANYVYNSGVVNVAAAGNDNIDAYTHSPSSIPSVVAVAATNHNDVKSCFSNFGASVDVAAPGGDSGSCANDFILSTRSSQSNDWFPPTPNSYYAIAKGTSMASPHVAGLAALVSAAHPTFTVEEIRAAIRLGADDVTGVAWDPKIGHGRINAEKTVSISNPPPVARITVPQRGGLSSVYADVEVSGIATSRSGFQKYELQVGHGSAPSSWDTVVTKTNQVNNGVLGTIPGSRFQDGANYVRLLVTGSSGSNEDRVMFTIDSEIMPGWPQPASWHGNPATGDIDGDGIKEVVYGTRCYLYARKPNGTLVNGFPRDVCLSGFSGVYPVILYDFNSDGKKEIVINTNDRLFVVKGDGRDYPGWPVTYTYSGESRVSARGTPAVGDVNNDGSPEIFVGATLYSKNSRTVFGFSSDGRSLSGWPIQRSGIYLSYSFFNDDMVLLVDLDRDGKLDVVNGSLGDGKVYAWNGSGGLISGWPRSTGHDRVEEMVFGYREADSEPIIAFKASKSTVNEGNLYLVDSSSNDLPGWPKRKEYARPSFADVDGDGQVEILLRDTPSHKIALFEIDGTPVSGWPEIVRIQDGRLGIGHGGKSSAAQVTGDSKLEVAVSIWDLYAGIYIYSYPGTLVWYRDSQYKQSDNFGVGSMIDISDIDNDNKPEVLAIEDFDWLLWAWKPKDFSSQPGDPNWEMAFHDSQNSANANLGTVVVPPDTEDPTVSITSPANGSVVSDTVNITASASDNVGVAKVEFLVDGVLKGQDTTSPYTYSWNTVTYSNGSHSLTANAYDPAGNVGTSSQVAVTVDNGSGDTQAPTVPTGVSATSVSSSQINLSWNASSDNVGVVGYEIRDSHLQPPMNTSSRLKMRPGTSQELLTQPQLPLRQHHR
jgi:subtilisin family serine protease